MPEVIEYENGEYGIKVQPKTAIIDPIDLAVAVVELWKINPDKLKEAFNEMPDQDLKAADAIRDIFEDRFKTEMKEFVVDQMNSDQEIYEKVVSYFDLEEIA